MLKNFVTIYVPSTKNGGEPLEPKVHKALVCEVATQFAKSFGGTTCTGGIGYWPSDSKGIIEEPVTLVKSYHSLKTREALAIVVPIAQAIKYRFNQEAVSIETEKGLKFI